MAPEIDKASFALGELTGKINQIEKTQNAIFEKLEDIEKSITNMKVKNAGQAGIIAAAVAYLQDMLHR